MEGPFRTNGGRTYRLRISVPAAFPAECPEMLVTDPVPLRNKHGATLSEPSVAMHVLGSVGGATKICHFRHSRWVPNNTLYLVALKGRIWLEAYDAHLRTGRPLDNFLRHMADDPTAQSEAGSGTANAEETAFARMLRNLLS